jgi:L-iditol 2-dehydrogenase
MTSPGEIEFRDVPVPRPGPDDVLIRVATIGVCGSDVHVRHGRHPFTSYPVVQGHEFSGVVEAVGKRVRNIRAGSKVTATPQIVCGRCGPCRRGDYHICDVLKVQGFQAPGCAQDLFVTKAANIVPLPASFSFEQGALVEPTAVGVQLGV